ncbi:hypothetical protein Aph01nite_38940 [Acrocarpospora phusangensis]|uniref:Uncharacterized protein n=1 Tax=Acrocarpospora phusangensis TaxID=1070424 RepID=A0A919QD90_9ACTN|nr:hypothetical protein Aph01nite_38940 [Acrocarpospora phusangensis]
MGEPGEEPDEQQIPYAGLREHPAVRFNFHFRDLPPQGIVPCGPGWSATGLPGVSGVF